MAQDTDEIRGPLGIWPFPILNALIKISSGGDSSSSVDIETYDVHRDNQGRIQSIEIIKKGGE